jgi:hypothetical protein
VGGRRMGEKIEREWKEERESETERDREHRGAHM